MGHLINAHAERHCGSGGKGQRADFGVDGMYVRGPVNVVTVRRTNPMLSTYSSSVTQRFAIRAIAEVDDHRFLVNFSEALRAEAETAVESRAAGEFEQRYARFTADSSLYV